jgi:NAD(P)-dependent dehydrogenase (short-subunit alcohol dehydrogenase family)
MTHPALKVGNTALITGGASGIGLAAAKRLAALGLNLVLVDLRPDDLKVASQAILNECQKNDNPGVSVRCAAIDVSVREQVFELAKTIGDIDVLMNNAAISGGGSSALNSDNWQRVLDTNLWGVIHGTQAFAPAMVASGRSGLIINTGSKQGITTPPGNPAYNVSKAGVKTFTETLQHELRNGPNPAMAAHLLIPGYVWTGMTQGGQTEKPTGAWTSEDTVDFMLESIGKGDFYILCPDNDVPRALDEKRMAWAIGDVIENRPPLSRWHPDYAQAFADFVKS